MWARNTTSGGALVLIADDDPGTRALLAARLRLDGHAVVEVASGSDVVEYIHRCALDNRIAEFPDVIVSDVRMPGLSGFQLLASLRSGRCSVPVILMTAFPDDEAHQLAARLGAMALLDKPFDVAVLRRAVSAAVRSGAKPL